MGITVGLSFPLRWILITSQNDTPQANAWCDRGFASRRTQHRITLHPNWESTMTGGGKRKSVAQKVGDLEEVKWCRCGLGRRCRRVTFESGS